MDARQRLDEWQVWSWYYLPDLGYSLNPINALLKEGDPDDEGYGQPAAPPPARMPVDQERAYATDRLIGCLAAVHVLTIKRHYLNRRRVDWEDLGAAQRALQDRLDG